MDGMVILKKEGRKVFMMLALYCLLGGVIWKRCRVSVAKGFASFFIQNPFSIFLSQLYSIDFRERIWVQSHSVLKSPQNSRWQ